MCHLWSGSSPCNQQIERYYQLPWRHYLQHTFPLTFHQKQKYGWTGFLIPHNSLKRLISEVAKNRETNFSKLMNKWIPARLHKQGFPMFTGLPLTVLAAPSIVTVAKATCTDLPLHESSPLSFRNLIRSPDGKPCPINLDVARNRGDSGR